MELIVRPTNVKFKTINIFQLIIMIKFISTKNTNQIYN